VWGSQEEEEEEKEKPSKRQWAGAPSDTERPDKFIIRRYAASAGITGSGTKGGSTWR